VVNLRHVRAAWKLGLIAVAVVMTGFARQQVKPIVVYHDGSRMLFTPHGTGTHRMAKVGRWDLGERLKNEKLREKRLNLYVVFPGEQYRSAMHRGYNHTLVINKYTMNGKPREWDVFWCLVLDPKLHTDLHSEHELLEAAQQRFKPASDFNVRRIPSHAAMAAQLRVTSVAGLRRFRRKDGSLPRLLIVPAHLAVRATTTKMEPVRGSGDLPMSKAFH
jgi:hypothetical protein